MINEEYNIRVWSWSKWLLLLLLVPFLFIPLEKDVFIKLNSQQSSSQLANIPVTFSYKKAHLYKDGRFLSIKNETLVNKTDASGVAAFDSLEYSVFSFIFFNLTRATINAESDCFSTGNATKFFHYIANSDTLQIGLKETTEDVQFKVIDASNNNALEGARVKYTWEYNGTYFTDSTVSPISGIITIPNFPLCGKLVRIYGEKELYYPDSFKNIRGLELAQPEFDKELRLIPIQNCDTRTKEDQPGINLYESQFDMGRNEGTFIFEYYTDTRPDKIEVFCDNKLLFSYNDATGESTSETVNLGFTNRTITVRVTGGSNWWYQVNCPN